MAATLTNAGFARIAALIGADTLYLAVGTGTSAFSAASTTLTTELTDSGLERASATVTYSTTNVTNDTINAAHTWTASAAKTVGEIALLMPPPPGQCSRLTLRVLRGALVSGILLLGRLK